MSTMWRYNQQMKDADQRQLEAAAWAARCTGQDRVQLQPVSGDASFRRYFRFQHEQRSVILMDAPPDKEDSAPFVDVARRLRSAGLNAPEIIHFDFERGFGLLEDLGDTLYRELISEESSDKLFPGLIDLLERMAIRVEPNGLPQYDEQAFSAELELFTTWYLGRHKKRTLQAGEIQVWDDVRRLLIDSALEQPRVFVHRDFHSCNLLRTAAGPAIIDFQDAMIGPVSYDLVSLIWDRYIAWPRNRLKGWIKDAYEVLPVNCTFPQWLRYCDLMGLQRNLKIVGIFSRLKYRDGKDGYLEMIPHFYQYLLDVLALYPEFEEFRHLLEQNECAP